MFNIYYIVYNLCIELMLVFLYSARTKTSHSCHFERSEKSVVSYKIYRFLPSVKMTTQVVPTKNTEFSFRHYIALFSVTLGWNLLLRFLGSAQALCFGSFVGVKYFWTLQKLSLNSMVRNSANVSNLRTPYLVFSPYHHIL